jgi:hypothetical protein
MNWPGLHALAVMKMLYADRITLAAGGWSTQSLSVPRSLRDHLFDAQFRRYALGPQPCLGFYISTGAMASELLGVTVDQVDPGEQRIGVHRKVRDGCNGNRPRRGVIGLYEQHAQAARQGRPLRHQLPAQICLQPLPQAASRRRASSPVSADDSSRPMNAAGSAKLKDHRPASPPKGLRHPVRAPDVSESGCQI